jgi:cytochrome c553
MAIIKVVDFALLATCSECHHDEGNNEGNFCPCFQASVDYQLVGAQLQMRMALLVHSSSTYL